MNEIDETSLIYVDTNVFIYFIEATPPFFEAGKKLIDRVAETGARIFTSELTLAECVYKPSKDGDAALVRIYEEFFETGGSIRQLPIDGALVKRAGLRGGALKLKLVDAIHFLSATEAKCDVFATADSQFRSSDAMRVLRIGEEV
jgi:predicted nucleic acid-binding protein